GDDARVEGAKLREEIRRHGGEVLQARAVEVARVDSVVRIMLTGGHLIVAHGLIDGSDDALRVPAIARTGGEPRSSNEADWDRRYSGDRVWSGNPNGTLVHELAGAAPGRALDVGAGEGGDAIWLAEQGWQVTASDVSSRALAHIAAAAADRGLAVECLHADANSPNAFGTVRFDLVSAFYASIPRTADDRAIRNVTDAVAPGGTLLVVGHDLAPMRAPIDTREHSRAFDPDAYVRVDDFAAALAGDSAWEIQVHETRTRPAGSATAGHHVDDAVFRARRRSLA
ncbi:MAG: class I SAM-dependent methyltransferase, partial [Ilumatobacteraceae bacterium]